MSKHMWAQPRPPDVEARAELFEAMKTENVNKPSALHNGFSNGDVF